MMATTRRRRNIVKAPSQQPMYVIAGLPKAIHKGCVDALQARLPHAIVKGIPSPTSDGALYSGSYLATLVRSIGEFVVRRRTNGNAQPTPASITLLFVPAPDQEALLGTFDFAIMSAPLSTLVAFDDRYRTLRHDRGAVNDALIAAVAADGEARSNLNQVVRRLGLQSDNEALLLPPRNFMTQDGDLTSTFRAYRQGQRTWTDRFADFGPAELNHDDVPARIHPKQTRRVFIDSRGMAFFIAHPTAYEAPPREVEDPENSTGILSALRALYRFGGALVPGIHHDAQRGDGSPLNGAIFCCDEKGRIRADATHANIYPDDFVRVRNYVTHE